MKKVTVFLLFLIAFGKSFSQGIVQRGSTTMTVQDARLSASQNLIIPRFADTTANVGGANYLANIGLDSCGAIIFTYDNNTLWKRACNPKRWVMFGEGNPSGLDSVYVKFPLGVYIDSTGHQVIYTRLNGLFDGGIVSWSGSGLVFDVTTANYGIDYFPYTSPTMQVTLDAAPTTMSRTDLFVVDTFALADKITGDSSNNPVVPQFNPSSQIGLTSITLNAGDTVPNLGLNVIYNEGIEWDTAKSGSINVSFSNTDNPYKGSRAIFVSSYSSGGQLIFTDSQQDTLHNGDLFKTYLYLNNPFRNRFQMQFFNGSSSVSNKLSLQQGFGLNPLDTSEYHAVVIPLNIFTFSSNFYDKVVITMQGYDTTGAGGFYLDYMQIQSGIFNPNADLSNKVDSNTIRNDSLFYWVKGQSFYVGQVGGVGSSVTLKTNGVNNGSQSILNLKNGTNTTIVDDGVGGVTINSTASGTGSTNSNIGSGYRLAVPSTNNIKTLFSGNSLFTLDSATNTNAITGTIDSSKLHTYNFYATNPFGYLSSNQPITVTATGDATGTSSSSATAPSLPLTLANVNSNVGTFGSATQVAQPTFNAKGLATGVVNVSIQIAESQVTNLVSDLAGKQATLVSGTNLKTVNGNSLLGSGDIVIGSGTTDDSTVVATSGQTVFTFPSTPSAKSDFEVYVWGIKVDPSLYTWSGATVTFLTGLNSGDKVNRQRHK